MGTWIEGKPWDTINGQFDFKVATKSFKLGKLLNGCRKTPAPGQKNRMNLFFKPWKIYRTAVHSVAPSQAAAKVHAWLTTYFIVKEFPLVAGKQSCPGPKTSSGRVFPHVLWGEDGQPHGQRANATLILWLPISRLASSQSHHHPHHHQKLIKSLVLLAIPTWNQPAPYTGIPLTFPVEW